MTRIHENLFVIYEYHQKSTSISANFVRTANRPGSQRVTWKKVNEAFMLPRTFGALWTGTVRL